MYSYIKGIVKDQESNYIVLDNNGIGYHIFVANPFQYKLDEEAKIYIYSYIREDEYSLYGFSSKDEKNLFLKLLNVKGVGPKLIMPMLATGSVNGIIDAIDRENILYLKKFPKIGDKVAKQMILDLKGKLGSIDIVDSAENSYDELIEVLKGLGYKEKEFKNVIPKIDNSLSIEDQVKETLKLLLK